MDHRPPDELEHAGFVSRLAAFVLDLLTLAIGSSAAVWVVNATETLLVPFETLGVRDAVYRALAAAFPLWLAYFAGLWWLTGQTLGKRVLGLRLVSRDGGRVPLARAIARCGGYVLSALPLYLGFVWVLFDPDRCAWHDRLTGTRVVYDRSRSADARGSFRYGPKPRRRARPCDRARSPASLSARGKRVSAAASSVRRRRRPEARGAAVTGGGVTNRATRPRYRSRRA